MLSAPFLVIQSCAISVYRLYHCPCRLTPDQAHSLQFQPQQAGPEDEVDFATECGRTARLYGDKLDRVMQEFRNQSQTRDFVDACVNESDPGQATSTTLQQFIEVARMVFEVDEGGLGMVSIDDHVCICLPAIVLDCPT